jgi:CheY-like chemotaxis protein
VEISPLDREIPVPKTLLAVDDSATMRKVLEITFSGEDFRVLTADGSQAALAKLGDEPRAVIIDIVLGADDGYALCKEIRRRDASAALILLSSRHNPYDQAKGRDAGADDFMDKPFDTQQMIDKVKKALLAREGGVAAQPAHEPPSQAPQARPAAPAFSPAPPVAAAAAAKPNPRGHTLMFGDNATPAPPPVQASAPQPQAASPQPAARPQRAEPVHSNVSRPAPAPAANPVANRRPEPVAAKPEPAARPAFPGAVAATVNGQLAGKLGDLGLSAAQVDAVLALSRDVVERVVWEVVPQLAETLIKEEIARLTKEG